MKSFWLKRTLIAATSVAMTAGLFPVNVLAEVPATETADDGYTLVWEDNFDGDALNTDDWNVEQHEPGWVNAELQRYTALDEGNIEVSDGTLKIKPHIEILGGSEEVVSEGSVVETSYEEDYSLSDTSEDVFEDEELLTEVVVTNISFDINVGEDKAESDTIAVQVNFGKIGETEAGSAAADVSISNISLKDEDGNELLANTTFDNGGEGWSCGITSPAQGSASYGDGNAYITIDNSGTANWNIQLQQGGIHFEPGKSYYFSMDATSTVDRLVEISFLDPENGYDWYAGSTQTIEGSKVVSGENEGSENEENPSGNPTNVGNKDISFDVSVGGDKNESSTIALQVNFGKIDDSAAGTAAAKVVLSDISLLDEDGNELLNNTSFANGGEGWSCGFGGSGKGSCSFENGKAYITIENSGDANWNIQLQQGGIHLVPGKTYKFSMNASSDVDRMTEISLLDPDNGYDWYGGSKATIAGSGSGSGEGGYGEITSGRITTQNKHDFTYGRFETRAKVPAGQGYLPAFWLMATDEGLYGQWPRCGEIDIMEVKGQDISTSYHTIHYGYSAGSGHKENQGSNVFAADNFADEFHTYRVDWDPGKISWYVDDELVYTTDDWYTGTDDDNQVTYPAPFDQDFYMILNLAVGGSWVGYPTDDVYAAMNDQAYEIDYVKVYQKSAEEYERLENEVKKPEKEEVTYREPDEEGNYVINGNFAKDIALDGAADADKDNWVLHLENDAKATTYAIADNSITISPSAVGSQNYSVQLKQENVPMYKGWDYTLTFDAVATEERDIVIDIEGPDKGWIRYFNDTTVSIGTEKQSYSYTFTMNEKTDPNGSLEFNLGKLGSTAAVTLSNIKLVHSSGEEVVDDDAKVIRPDGNYIYNGSFDQGDRRLGYWEFSEDDAKYISVTNVKNTRELKVTVPKNKVVKLRQSGLAPIVRGDYEISFKARMEEGSAARGITVDVAGKSYSPTLETTNKKFAKNLNFDEDNSREESYVEILFKNPGTYYLDDIFLCESALIKNGSFNAGMAGFEPYIYDTVKATYVVDNMNGNDNAFAITIEDTKADDAGNSWYVQLNQDGVTLEEGKSYRLTFKAKSSIERVISYAMQEFEGAWTNYSGTGSVSINNEWQTFSTDFTMNYPTDTATRFNITMGSVDGVRITQKHDVFIDDISLVEIESAVDNQWGEVAEIDRTAFDNADEIPEGLWAAGISDAEYRASAVTFANLHVYYGKKMLKSGVDYTVKYANNVNVSTEDSKATVTITGTGDYSGTVTESFNILPLSLGDGTTNNENLKVADVQAEATGSVIKATTTAFYVINGNDVQLKAGTDFDYDYSEVKAEAGTYKVKLVGKGNFTGSTGVFNLTVYNKGEKINISKLNFAKIADQKADGTAKEPALSITDKNNKKNLVAGEDYTVAYHNNIEAGTATAVVTGKGNYAGTKTLTFKIKGIAISSAKFSIGSVTYTGYSVTPAYLLTYKGEAEPLREGTDYEVSISNNVNKGTGKISFTGKGRFTGTVNKTFKILPYNFKDGDVYVNCGKKSSPDVTADLGKFVYTKNGVKPVVSLVREDGKVLTLNKDYKVKYSNNNAVAGKKSPTVVITGAGNYAGSFTRTFTITKANLGNATIAVSDINATGKAGNCKPSITVYDSNGVKLAAGKDYDNKAVVYEYTSDATITRKNGKKTTQVAVVDGDKVDVKNDIIPSGMSVRVVLTGKGLYEGSNEAVFVCGDVLLNKATVRLVNNKLAISNNEINITENDIQVKVGTVPLSVGAYRITSCKVNSGKGTVDVTIVGTGSYGKKYYAGTKTVTLKVPVK